MTAATERTGPPTAGTSVAPPARLSMAGTATVVRFNWPKYAGVVGLAGAAVTGRRLRRRADRRGDPAIRALSSAPAEENPSRGSVLFAQVPRAPGALVAGLGLAGVLGATWSMTSLAATWWVYDHRRVYDQVGLGLGLGSVTRWASVHAGFDEATPRVAVTLGCEPAAVAALSPPGRASLRRARGGNRPAADDDIAASLPLTSGSLDAVFLTFAVHEVRDRTAQRALFAELRRALAPGGLLVVTEHLCDGPGLAVFGPGAFHFQTGAIWSARAAEAGLTPVEDTRLSPFVHRLVWRR